MLSVICVLVFTWLVVLFVLCVLLRMCVCFFLIKVLVFFIFLSAHFWPFYSIWDLLFRFVCCFLHELFSYWESFIHADGGHCFQMKTGSVIRIKKMIYWIEVPMEILPICGLIFLRIMFSKLKWLMFLWKNRFWSKKRSLVDRRKNKLGQLTTKLIQTLLIFMNKRQTFSFC